MAFVDRMCETTRGEERLRCWRGNDHGLACDLRTSWFNGCGTQLTALMPGRTRFFSFLSLLIYFGVQSARNDSAESSDAIEPTSGWDAGGLHQNAMPPGTPSVMPMHWTKSRRDPCEVMLRVTIPQSHVM